MKATIVLKLSKSASRNLNMVTPPFSGNSPTSEVVGSNSGLLVAHVTRGRRDKS